MNSQVHEEVAEDKLTLTPFDSFRVPIGNQEIALHQVDFAQGGMSLLRVRIREGRRFTIFDIDPVTARRWGESFLRWAALNESQDAALIQPCRVITDSVADSPSAHDSLPFHSKGE